MAPGRGVSDADYILYVQSGISGQCQEVVSISFLKNVLTDLMSYLTLVMAYEAKTSLFIDMFMIGLLGFFKLNIHDFVIIILQDIKYGNLIVSVEMHLFAVMYSSIVAL